MPRSIYQQTEKHTFCLLSHLSMVLNAESAVLCATQPQTAVICVLSVSRRQLLLYDSRCGCQINEGHVEPPAVRLSLSSNLSLCRSFSPLHLDLHSRQESVVQTHTNTPQTQPPGGARRVLFLSRILCRDKASLCQLEEGKRER